VDRAFRDLPAYDYELPEDRIRLRPPDRREESQLLVVPRKGAARDRLLFRTVSDLPGLLDPGDRLVVNDSRVVPARVFGMSGGNRRVEILFLGPFDGGGPGPGPVRFLGRGIRSGSRIALFSGRAELVVLEYREHEGCYLGQYQGPSALDAELEREGEMPLPPYIQKRRKADPSDRDRYQTVYSRVSGSVAAPTAGLHLGVALLADLAARGIEVSTVTLHVGLGTFRPLSEGPLDSHRMHSEWFSVPEETVSEISRTKRQGGQVIAVGTTSLRALESSMVSDGTGGEKRIVSRSGWTDLFIRPGHRFGPVDGLLTNFHTPRSTLLVLVDTFLGGDRWRGIYAAALGNGFMFLSYGDAMLIL
jgi:S-adenosylmethionine:tRNA ribosyltransferase-isomerase